MFSRIVQPSHQLMYLRSSLRAVNLGGARALVTADSVKPMKRFYDQVSVQNIEGGWRVMLDNKVVKTPKKTLLNLPSLAVADAVADEWRSQGEYLSPKEMPLMTIACTALDMVRPGIDASIERMLPYLETDTVCYEDDLEPLADLQNKEWAPLRKWYEDRFGISLGIARGLAIPAHSEGWENKVREHLKQRNEWELTAIEVSTQVAKSLVVATALVDRDDVDAEYALRWALLEEFFQIDRWGLVEGEHDKAHSEALIWLGASQKFVALSRQ